MPGAGGKEKGILKEYFNAALCSFLSCTSVSGQSCCSRHHELRAKVTNEGTAKGRARWLCHTPVTITQGEMSNQVQDPFRKSGKAGGGTGDTCDLCADLHL